MPLPRAAPRPPRAAAAAGQGGRVPPGGMARPLQRSTAPTCARGSRGLGVPSASVLDSFATRSPDGTRWRLARALARSLVFRLFFAFLLLLLFCASIDDGLRYAFIDFETAEAADSPLFTMADAPLFTAMPVADAEQPEPDEDYCIIYIYI